LKCKSFIETIQRKKNRNFFVHSKQALCLRDFRSDADGKSDCSIVYVSSRIF
jgi:hypothetical protein